MSKQLGAVESTVGGVEEDVRRATYDVRRACSERATEEGRGGGTNVGIVD
jgi:hypothetical protein